MIEYVVPCEYCKFYQLTHWNSFNNFYSPKGEMKYTKNHNSSGPEFFCAEGRLKEKDESTNCL